ncbi:putative phosphoribosyl transferase [Catalinimonas alkaloidigena]|uniref:phosphoribosyltransferase n=1 Tax=Catalinimonas alkaloidigena TaxID=1075417 RepID=UPI00240659B0|nr:phosphoribosyltransferase family protein [Catalinimonas alkaloidigena]MDF9796585.1 putative phosphoribosyl transferase [Catalinimonas alkaloidigena]
MINNREEAAIDLGQKLKHLPKDKLIVLGIPRGGVLMAKIIADQLSVPFDVVMTKKIGHPRNPELAVGAVSMDSEVAISKLSIPEKYFNEKAEETRRLLRERYEKYTGKKDCLAWGGYTVILVDDGIATGNTMMATIKLLRKQKPDKIVVAVPVAPPESVKKISEAVDECVVLECPENFSAISQFYEEFHQVNDEEVISILNS